MALANDLQALGDRMIKEYEDRKKSRAELKNYVQDLLEQISEKRKETSIEIWESLLEARSKRHIEVSNLLEEYIQDRSQARKNWENTLRALAKMRAT
jgi:hypothetical protein